MDMLAEELLKKSQYDFYDLMKIMEILRGENGCPWDREQDHKSIRKNFIEETYEVCEAIDNEDIPSLREELGDVLMQVCFHSRIAEELSEFNIDDVTDEVCKKLIYRHPHVFGDVTVNDSNDVLKNWDALKKVEKNQKSVGDILDSVPKTLPALMYSYKLIEKAKKNNVCVSSEDGFVSEEEAGDFLFEYVKKCRASGIDPEKALYDRCLKFIKECSK